QLAESPAGVHEGRRVGQELEGAHAAGEPLGDGPDLLGRGAVALVGGRDGAGDPLDELVRDLSPIAGLGQVAPLEHRASVGRELHGLKLARTSVQGNSAAGIRSPPSPWRSRRPRILAVGWWNQETPARTRATRSRPPSKCTTLPASPTAARKT